MMGLPGFTDTTVEHGFPNQPSALAFDPELRIMAIGTSAPASLTRVTVVLLVAGSIVALGTESGSIFFLDVATLTLLEGQTLSPDEVLRSVPDDYRCGKALGPVESLQGHLQDPTKILIGYSRGLLVIWSQATQRVDHIFLGNQQLESLCWGRGGSTVISSHSDGSYAIWSTDTGSPPTLQPTVVTTPYGPFPCKAINKILWRSCESGDHFIIFSGGMPRASYGDRHCVSVLRAETLVTLDFTSRVIDFFTVHSTQPEDEFDNPQALAVLLEEELVVLDLQTPGWPAVPAPYLAPLHSSAITCSAHVANVPSKLWARIVSAGERQSPQPASSALSWPITGGRNLAQEPSQRGLLLTGHEDGTVRFWDASGVALRPLYKLSTAGLFQTDCEHADSLAQAVEDDWPPFRKVLVLELSDTPAEQAVSVASVDLLQDREGFTWKGHERLSPHTGVLPWPAGFQPRMLVQCLPPAAVTAVTLHAEWSLVAFGTSHGFGLFDYQRKSPVLARCTLHPNDSLAMEGPLSRVKSLKKSLRQSFRRIRKSRVSGKKRATTANSKLQEANAQLAEQTCPHDVEMTPVQRRIEPRSADDSLSGVVRCLYFADTFLRDGFYLISPSEFERFSLSARNITEPLCSLDISCPRNATQPSHRPQESPKLSQANGTRNITLAPESCEGSPNSIHSKRADITELPEATLSPVSIDSATSGDTTLDTTGDVTVEYVKDFLGSPEDSEKNLRNLEADEARAYTLLIK
ncbi:putative lethal(2) giant larvae protein [Cricetulus griseus]|nr:putative lethal(2) giant larvae protein [Cricetulus griseus]